MKCCKSEAAHQKHLIRAARYRAKNKDKIKARQKAVGSKYTITYLERKYGSKKAGFKAVSIKYRDYRRLYKKRRGYAYNKPKSEKAKATRSRIQREWQKRNPEKVKIYWNRKRIKRASALGSHTAPQWLAKLEEFCYRCVYCGNHKDSLTKDHVVPLSRGGTDFIENIVPACRSCNLKKGVIPADKFMAQKGSGSDAVY